MEINELLAEIQQNLNAPKNQFNSFGKYKYRNCEDIVEAVKPLLNGATLIITDEIVMIGDRYYVKAVACLYHSITPNTGPVCSTAYAREALEKKGMDVAQITGAASSYARKYALNGLFAIDDTKDADHGKKEKVSPEPIDMKKVGTAVNWFKKQIDADAPEETHEKIKTAYSGLTNDEKSKVNELLDEKAEGSGKSYKSLLKIHLDFRHD